MRVGFGYDIHGLVEGRPLILGGVEIPHPTGLDGHSDADVLCHAVADALLGAASAGDIGSHFPDTEAVYKDVSSLDLLAKVGILIRKRGFRIVNIDATVVAESPKIAPYRERMIDGLSQALKMERAALSVKATTNEKFGPAGRSEAIQAYAVALIDERVPEKG